MPDQLVSYDQLWQTTLGELEVVLSKPSFITWFKHTFIIDVTQGIATIGVPTSFALEWLSSKYQTHILDVLRKLLPEQQLRGITFRIAQQSSYQPPIEQELIPSTPAKAEIRESASTSIGVPVYETFAIPPGYTFENFIVGTHNRLAHAASLAVASEPGTRHNPLFIYGGVGLGKTHLIYAIGNEIARRFPKKRILYAPCERFANEFIQAIQNKKTEEFKQRYRNVDVLLIDDIQFLSNKAGTQEEFFHTFNALHQTNRQIILTSDRQPQAISELEDRLSSRFVWGMVTDIKSPDLETRTAIVGQKCVDRKANLPSEVIELLAQTYHQNIRELEGGLNQLLAYAELEGIQLTRAIVEGFLAERQPHHKSTLSVERILTIISQHYQITTTELLGPRRHKELVHPRQITMYLLRSELEFSFPKIGRELNKDHTTIMHGVEKIEKAVNQNPHLQEEINLLKTYLYQQ